MEAIKNHIIETVLMFITSGVALTLRSIKKAIKGDIEEKKVIKQGLVGLLHNSLFHRCEDYISRGEITTSELDNLEALYESYHSLGGNGTGTALYERCKNLDIKTQ